MKTLSAISNFQEKKKLKQIILKEILKQQGQVFQSYKQRRNAQYLQLLKGAENVEAEKYKQVQQLQKLSLRSKQFNEKIMELFQPFQKSLSSKKIMFKIVKKENKNQQHQPTNCSKIPHLIDTKIQLKDQELIRVEDTQTCRKIIQFSQIQRKGAHSIQSHDAMQFSAEPTTRQIKEEQGDQFTDSNIQITGLKQKPSKKQQKPKENKKEIVQIAQFQLSQSIDKFKSKGQVRYIYNQPKTSHQNPQTLPEQQDQMFLN